MKKGDVVIIANLIRAGLKSELSGSKNEPSGMRLGDLIAACKNYGMDDRKTRSLIRSGARRGLLLVNGSPWRPGVKIDEDAMISVAPLNPGIAFTGKRRVFRLERWAIALAASALVTSFLGTWALLYSLLFVLVFLAVFVGLAPLLKRGEGS